MNSIVNQVLKGVNLYLIGMMGAGKTTVGQLLAQELGYHFFDTDAVIEKLKGQSIAEIFAELGEEEFRQLETQVLGELSSHTRLAIATGGGIVLRPENWSYLHHGIVVWLDVPVEQLYERLQGDRTRPLLQTPDPIATLQNLMTQRHPLYAQADLRVPVSADASPSAIAAHILTTLPTILKPAQSTPDPTLN